MGGASGRARRVLVAVLVATAMAVPTACSSDPAPAAESITIDVDGLAVHALRLAGPRRAGWVATVLFLHGQAYTSRIWADRHLLDTVARTGNVAVAVDLPGHGATPERGDDGLSDGAWLKRLVAELGGPSGVVVVSPSMSGRYSLGMLQEFPDLHLAGLVAVAPVGIDEFDRPAGAVPVPAAVVYGRDDPAYAPARADHLVAELGHADPTIVEVWDDTGHAAYDERPGAFSDVLTRFLNQIH